MNPNDAIEKAYKEYLEVEQGVDLETALIEEIHNVSVECPSCGKDMSAQAHGVLMEALDHGMIRNFADIDDFIEDGVWQCGGSPQCIP